MLGTLRADVQALFCRYGGQSKLLSEGMTCQLWRYGLGCKVQLCGGELGWGAGRGLLVQGKSRTGQGVGDEAW